MQEGGNPVIPEERLREAATKADEQLMAGLPGPKDLPAGDTKKLIRAARKIYRRTTHPVWYWAKRSVACILLTVLIGGTSVLTFSTEARAAFFGWVREVYETYFAYAFVGEGRETDENTIYCPTWIPDGYTVLNEPLPGETVMSSYVNDRGEYISIISTSENDPGILHVGGENVIVTQASVNGLSADLYLDGDEGDTNILIWVDDEKGLLFSITGALDGDTLIKIAESFEPVIVSD